MFCRRCAGFPITFLRPLSSFLLLLSAFLLPLFSFAAPLCAQLEPPSTGGTVALDQELRMLGHYKRVLMIGAHPDDEDTELLTILVRGEGAEAAYLSLNRGEGGQNLLGPELGEALGLLRTEELLAARRLDGARQYFTRAYDFGYSKSLDETWQHWPKDSILKDVVRIVRRFRPQIVVSIFSGTPRDGHGQHQAAGWAAIEAFRVAGDSTRFPELQAQERLEPWTPLKLYRSTRFDSSATTLTLDGGELDPAVGKSFHQIAMAGRSLHRSQDMGQLQTIGPSAVRLQLLEDRTGGGSGALWAGLDTTFQHFSDLPPGTQSRHDLTRARAEIDSARARYNPSHPWEITDHLRRAADAITWRHTRQCGMEECGILVVPEITEALGRLRSAAAAAQGLVFDATGDDERVVAGQPVHVRLTLWNPSPRLVDAAIGLDPPPVLVSRTRPLKAGDLVRADAEVLIRRDAVPSAPYFLRHPRVGDLYAWQDAAPATRGEPFDPPDLLAWGVDSTGAFESREIVRRVNDQARGEVRRPITIVPRVDVKLEPAVLVWPAGATTPRRFTVTLAHGARDTTTGTLRLELPAGWPEVASQPFRLTRQDEIEAFTFSVRAPATPKATSTTLRAVARDSAGTDYDTGVFTVDYPHIRPRSWTGPAVATINVARLVLPRLTRVGYVRGAADRVPEALRSVGVPVELLDGAALVRGDLSRYGAIVIGPRAYETDPELVANNRRLLEYVRAGGLVIVQYQQYPYFTGGFAPYPLTVGGQPLQLTADSAPPTPPPGVSQPNGSAPPPRIDRHDRVTDETAPVRIVDPRSPVVLRPNRIGPADWDGWVQERGLYFARTWDPRYRTVFETHDRGEGRLEGGLLVAAVGKGTYVYTGLAFFRQLPAGVPGAFRLFANLLALRSAVVVP